MQLHICTYKGWNFDCIHILYYWMNYLKWAIFMPVISIFTPYWNFAHSLRCVTLSHGNMGGSIATSCCCFFARR